MIAPRLIEDLEFFNINFSSRHGDSKKKNEKENLK